MSILKKYLLKKYQQSFLNNLKQHKLYLLKLYIKKRFFFFNFKNTFNFKKKYIISIKHNKIFFLKFKSFKSFFRTKKILYKNFKELSVILLKKKKKKNLFKSFKKPKT